MKNLYHFAAGLLIGAALFGGGTAYAAEILAERNAHSIYVDGQQVQMEAYSINGNNYVKLRDIGQAVGFNVYWDNGVQVDSGAAYTGEKPLQTGAATHAASGSMEIRQEMVRLINQVRKEHGVAELKIDNALMNAAQDCSAQLFTYHQNRVECETVAAYGYPHGFGSNLTVFTGVAISNAPQKAVSNWAKSPGHLETMLEPDADTVGVGFTVDNNRIFCYMFVGRPSTHNPYA